MFLVVKIKVSRGGFYIRTQLLEGVIIIKVAADYSLFQEYNRQCYALPRLAVFKNLEE